MTPEAHFDVTTRRPAGSASQLSALLNETGISPLTGVGWIRVTGDDRVRWLNGMVTNSIQQQLNPIEGSYNFILSVQGRIQGDAYIFAEPDALLIETAATQIPVLMPLLDRYIIMDDVELKDTTGTQAGISISGPKAASMLHHIGLPVEDLGTLQRRTLSWNGTDIVAIHAYSPVVPHFELWADAAVANQVTHSLLSAGAVPCEPESREWLRLLEGTPLYGKDIRDRELPQETGQTRALHFSKGCYLGQEIVERIRSRGNVHRIFGAFRLEGELPGVGSPLEADGKQVGELTSIASIPLPDGSSKPLQFALGYVRREALDRDLPLVYAGGVASPVSLPFLTDEAFGLRSASEPSERV